MSIDSGFIGSWRLNGDCQDSSGNNNHGHGYGADFAEGPGGKPNSAAVFNGVDASIEIPHSDSLDIGQGDFSLAAWVRLDEDAYDIVSKFDETSRRGFNFYIKGSSASTTAPSSWERR